MNKEKMVLCFREERDFYFSLWTFNLHHFINYKLLFLRAETEIKNLNFSISFHQKH